MSSLKDWIGRMGEAVFEVAMVKNREFSAAYLGEKWEAADFMVEIATGEHRYFFLVQVKSTGQISDSTKPPTVAIGSDKLQALLSYPAPTYLALVDVKSERVYLKAAMGAGGLARSFPIEFDEAASHLLIEDVIEFWGNADIRHAKSAFKSRFE